MKLFTFFVLGCLALVPMAQAASFDCTKAQSKVEHIICDNEEISKLDEAMATSYKVALRIRAQGDSVKQEQTQWLKRRNTCKDVACVNQSYEERIASLRNTTSNPLTTPIIEGSSANQGVHNAPSGSGCNGSIIRVEDITGLFSQSVEGQPALVGQPDEKLHGFNYLAITAHAGNHIRVRLATKEINGHDCGIDSEALHCGETITLLPSKEESLQLEKRHLSVPRLRVTADRIAFIQNANGGFDWGPPYCGAMGYLKHSFMRSTRKQTIDDALFAQ